jgi:hypothetical protein
MVFMPFIFIGKVEVYVSAQGSEHKPDLRASNTGTPRKPAQHKVSFS